MVCFYWHFQYVLHTLYSQVDLLFMYRMATPPPPTRDRWWHPWRLVCEVLSLPWLEIRTIQLLGEEGLELSFSHSHTHTLPHSHLSHNRIVPHTTLFVIKLSYETIVVVLAKPEIAYFFGGTLYTLLCCECGPFFAGHGPLCE